MYQYALTYNTFAIGQHVNNMTTRLQ